MSHWLCVMPIGESSEPVWKIYTEDGILAEFWETWLAQANAYNLANGLEPGNGCSPLRCIDDWITINWAVPATKETLLNIITAPKPQLI